MCTGYAAIVRRFPQRKGRYYGVAHSVHDLNEDDFTNTIGDYYTPTHWMSIPNPPPDTILEDDDDIDFSVEFNLQDPECLFDPVVVEAVLIKSMLLPSYFSEENDYSKNFNSISHRIDQLKIEWLPIGTTFQVVDGGDNGEWIQKFKDIKLFTA